MTGLPDAARLAVGTLTVLPVPPPRTVGPRVAAGAMLLAPLAALLLAVPAAGLAWALGGSPLVAAVLAVAVLAVGSGALHLDGLADTADGLVVQGDRSRRLEVMRRGDVGPAGVAALVLVLLLQVVAVAELLAGRPDRDAALTLGLAVVASRVVLALACARGVPGARSDGLGRGVAGSVPVAAAVAAVGILVVVAVLVDGGRGAAGVAAAVGGAALVLGMARLRLGGVTGDVLGACVEVALAGYLVGQVVG